MNQMGIIVLCFLALKFCAGEKPVKSLVLLLAAISVFLFWNFLETKMILMNQILYMLYVGGVLMMFMILTATMPAREKVGCYSWSLPFISTSALILVKEKWNLKNNESSMGVIFSEQVFSSDIIMVWISKLFLMYFMVFMAFLIRSKGSLRGYFCSKESTFVKF